MIRGISLTAAAFMMLAAPALAAAPDAACKEPTAPAMPDATVTTAKASPMAIAR